MEKENCKLSVSIVIPTFRRTHLLRKTLNSCLSQTNFNGLMEIIVVDNSSEGSAETVVCEHRQSAPIPILYLSVTKQNIALARNAGVSSCSADFVAFIDDDEEATCDWLSSLVTAQLEHKADVVFGPTYPIFEDGKPPKWDLTAAYYTRDISLPTGAHVEHGATANVLVRRTCFAEVPRWFDPDFGLTGGSDTEFFMRLSLLGKKLIWCAEAKVKEFIPKNRSTTRYVIKRNLRSNQSFVRCCVNNSKHPVITSVRWMLVGLVQATIWSIPAFLTLAINTPFSVRSRRKFIGGIGKMFWQKYFWVYFYAS